MGLVVELLGPPGAGKSTLAAAVARELRADGQAVELGTAAVTAGTGTGQRLRAKAGLVTTAVRARPLASARAVVAIVRSSQPDLGAVAHRTVAWLVAQGLLERARRTDAVTVLDEGALQAVWSLGLYGEHRGLLHVWSRRPELWQVGDVVVVLLPAPEQLEARLTARPDPHSRIERLPPHERLAALRHGRMVAEEVAAVLPAMGRPGITVVHLPGDVLDIDAAARFVATRLRRVQSARQVA